MSRTRGTFNFAANLEPGVESPLDARLIVATKAELIDPSTWDNGSGQYRIYTGMPVCVTSDTSSNNNGMYYLSDKVTFTDISTWIKVGSENESVSKAGDTMTGPLITPAIIAINASLNDVSIGTLFLDGVSITTIDTSAESFGQTDTALATSAAIRKFVDQQIIAGVEAWNGITETDSSLGLGGTLSHATIITSSSTNTLSFGGLQNSSLNTPYAFISEDASGLLKIRQLGTMSWEASTNYYDKNYIDASLNILTQWEIAQDASIVLRLKEASLGNTFVWNAGQVDVSISTLFNPAASDTLLAPEKVGGIPQDTSVGGLRGKSYDDLWLDLLFPTVIATFTGISAGLNWPSGATVEVGTPYDGKAMGSYNPGTIYNGNGTTAGNLTGDAYYYTFKLPNGTIDAEGPWTTNSSTHTFSSYKVIFGDNRWTADVSYNIGTTVYTDNKGGTAPIPAIESAKVAGKITATSASVVGRRYAWWGYGTVGSAPAYSGTVRALGSKVFLSSSDTGTFDINLVAGATCQEAYFYVPAGKTLSDVLLVSTNVSVKGTFVKTTFNVDDGGGVPALYDSYVGYIGLSGYPNPDIYRVTIA